MGIIIYSNFTQRFSRVEIVCNDTELSNRSQTVYCQLIDPATCNVLKTFFVLQVHTHRHNMKHNDQIFLTANGTHNISRPIAIFHYIIKVQTRGTCRLVRNSISTVVVVCARSRISKKAVWTGANNYIEKEKNVN